MDLSTEGSSLEAIGRVLGVKSGTLYSWVKKSPVGLGVVAAPGGAAVGWPTAAPPARVIFLDEMWTCVGVRRGGQRREVWVWTSVVEEGDGRRWVDFQAGDRSEAAFLKLYDRLPEAQRYVSDGYRAYEWLPQNRHVAGKAWKPTGMRDCTRCCGTS